MIPAVLLLGLLATAASTKSFDALFSSKALHIRVRVQASTYSVF